MTLVFLEQLPLPSLKTYVTVSFLLFVSSCLYAINTIWNSNEVNTEDLKEKPETTIYDFMTADNFCFWSNLNMAYCCLFIFGKIIQRVVFGDLREAELQQIQDRFWNFVFYKFIFIFGVLNVQKVDEVMWWTAWFTLLGFFQIFSQLCKNRFEYLSFSPTTSPGTHGKIIGLLIVLLMCCNGLFFLSLFIGWPDGIHTFTFMLAECLLLFIKIVHVGIRYGIHLWEIGHVGTWEGRATWCYYTDLLLDLGTYSVDLVHHLHMLLWSNIFLSMASLVLCMQLRHLFYEIKKRLARHRNFIRILKCMEKKFPTATNEELVLNNDDCAICWDTMEVARKLPCGHIFHSSCLRSWLENDTSCPTCRQSLADDLQPENNQENEQPRGMAAFMMGHAIRRNHFFHFDGTQIASWFPSFSVEVVHSHANEINANQQLPESRLELMAHQVQDLFPRVPFNIIIEDLRQTHSVELTTDNFLEGRIAVPSVWTPPEQQPEIEAELLQTIHTADSDGSQSDETAERSDTDHISITSPWIIESDEEMPSTSNQDEMMPTASDETPNEENRDITGAGQDERPPIAESRDDITCTKHSPSEMDSTSYELPSSEFHSSSEERQLSLMRRKQAFFQTARRRFLGNKPSSS
ncbi:E3 ubiquitin-protein ligase AMFR-like isoform X3 [Actinia tenebrosa]|uniref:E3 ubiquitin-protein ligase AMFR-like isoform X3 n=1 Tax=Actinia tenebrosa TaxID=6105 RepID=A0A6P8IY17_ACTTE|nr:E3 ubiquitin-protein ligase AMFR-like isoform X3 [Actinia tenebrosa]